MLQDLSLGTMIFDLLTLTLKFDLLLKNFNLGHHIAHVYCLCQELLHGTMIFDLTLTLKFDLVLKNFNGGYYLMMVAARRASLSSDNSLIICCDICKTSSYSCIEVNDKHRDCPPSVTAQNTEYFGLYRNSQLRCDVTPTSRIFRRRNALTQILPDWQPFS